MLKRSMAIVIIFSFVVMAATGAYCDDAMRKLGRGICNSVTFPVEILEQINRTNVSDGPMAAMTYGILKGVGMSVLRACVGVYEVVTFPVPFPKEYKPILTDPEFFFENTNW